MKNFIVSISIYCLMATQAFAFTTTYSGSSLSASWWNPMSYVSDVYSSTVSVLDSYFGSDEKEISPVKEDTSFYDTFSSSISNTWFNFTSFMLNTTANPSCMATNSNGSGCPTCDNSGLIALNDLHTNLMCNMSTRKRAKLNSKQQCQMSSLKSKDVDKCINDENIKQDYCQSCLEMDKDGGGGLADQAEVADLMKKAVEMRKDELIKQTFKDYKAISEETLDFSSNPFLQEGIGEDFLCSPGKIMNLQAMLMTDSRSGCQQKTMDKVKSSIVGFVEHCISNKDSSCPRDIQPGQNIPANLLASLNDKNNGSDLSQLELLVSTDDRMTQIAQSLNDMPAGTIPGLVNNNQLAIDRTTVAATVAGAAAIVSSASHELFNKIDLEHLVQAPESAPENISEQRMVQGTQLVASNAQLFSVGNYLGNLKKIFDPNFNCEGDSCEALYTYLRFDPSIGSILEKSSENGKLDYKTSLLKFKDHYAMKAHKDIAKSENIKIRNNEIINAISENLDQLKNSYDITKSEDTLKEINDHIAKITALNTENTDRDKIIQKQEAFIDQVANNESQIDPVIFENTIRRMQQSRIEDIQKKCQDVVQNLAQICKMDNNPSSYKATDLIGADFSKNKLLAEKLLDKKYSSLSDKNKKIKKLSIVLDKVSCYEQNKYASPNLKTGYLGYQTFYSLEGKAEICSSQGILKKGRHSQFAIFQEDQSKLSSKESVVDYNYQSIGMCPEYGQTPTRTEELLAAAGLGEDSDALDFSIGSANEGSLYTPVISNPQSSVASAINKIRNSSRYSGKISSSDINSILSAAGGGSSNISSNSVSGRSTTSTDQIGEEISTSYGEVSSESNNATDNVVNQGQLDGMSADQISNIKNEISNDDNIRKQSEQIINNDKAVSKIEQTINEIEKVKANSDSEELNTDLDVKLAQLQKQIEDLKKQNEELKSNRDIDIARVRDERIQQEIAKNNAKTGAFDVEVATSSNLGTGTEASINNNVSNYSDTGSGGSLSNISSGSSGSSTSSSGDVSTTTADSNIVSVNNQYNGVDTLTGLESQGLTLDTKAQKLIAINGKVVASGDELLIVAETVKSLTSAKALALSKKKQAFVYKGKAYMKTGRDYVLAPQRRSIASRTEIAEIQEIRQIDNLLETLEEDPFKFDDDPELQTTQLDPIIEKEIIKDKKVTRDRAYVSDLISKLNQGLKI
jgi:hypothetical protein